MSLLIPGMHVPVESPIHRMDPRVKMAASLLLMVMPFAVPDPVSNVVLVALVGAVTWLSHAPFAALLRTMRTVLWLGVFMFFFYLFTTPGESLIAWRGLTVTWEGALKGATQIYRLCLLVIMSALLTFTTSPAQLAHGLEAAFGPLARLGFPVQELALVLTIALRFVPTLLDQIDKITKAQRARGADFASWQPWRRVSAWVPTFVPIFVAAFRRAEDLATAMEARGFRGARQRTHLQELRLTRLDLIASMIVLATALAMVALAPAA